MRQRFALPILSFLVLLIVLPAGAQILEIHAYESIPIQGLVIEFEKLLFEQRCPADVVCIWEGDAAIRVRVESGSAEPQTFELHTHVDAGSVAEGNGYILTLIQLLPRPLLDKEPIPEEYVATLLLTKTAPTETLSWAAAKAGF